MSTPPTKPDPLSSPQSSGPWRSRIALAMAMVLGFGVFGVATVRLVPRAMDEGNGRQATVAELTGAWRPINNDCSGGKVVFTFDDGPDESTALLLDQMKALNVHGVFFVNSVNINSPEREAIVRREAAEGHIVGNHTYDHTDLVTGVATSGLTLSPWGPEQVANELEQVSARLEGLGISRPRLYRPPYGSISPGVDEIARKLGYRLVMSWGVLADSNLVDSLDYRGLGSRDIVDRVVAAVGPDTIITMHDGQNIERTMNSVAALQPIVDQMNEKRLCSTTDVRPDATGGVLDPDVPPELRGHSLDEG